MKKQQGFTIYELAIVTAIIAILAAVALPSYGHYMKRVTADRTKQRIQEIAMQLERNYSVCQRYNIHCMAGNTLSYPSEYFPDDGRSWYYLITVRLSRSSFEITAEARASGSRLNKQTDYKCYTMTLDHYGERTAKDRSGSDKTTECWK